MQIDMYMMMKNFKNEPEKSGYNFSSKFKFFSTLWTGKVYPFFIQLRRKMLLKPLILFHSLLWSAEGTSAIDSMHERLSKTLFQDCPHGEIAFSGSSHLQKFRFSFFFKS